MSNIVFKKLTMSNFMSYGKGPTEIDLSTGNSWLVLGENRDVGSDGESANGAGKSNWMQALVFCIYGEGVEKLKADEFVNKKNEKKLVVSVNLSINGVDYKITRGRKPSFVEFKSGSTSLTRDSMSNTDADIQRVLGISHDVFVRTIFMNSSLKPFMAMTPAEQRNFMESMLKIDVLASRAETLKNVIRKKTQDDITLLNRDIQNAEATNAKGKEHIKKLESRRDAFEIDKKSAIEGYQKEMDSIDISDVVEKGIKEIEVLKGKIADIERDSAEKVKTIESFIVKETNTRQVKTMLKDMYIKRDKFNVQNQEEHEANKNELNSLPPSNAVLEYISLREEIDKIIAERDSAILALSTVRLDKKDRERDLNNTIDEVEILIEGKCPYCNQEHFDNDKVERLSKKAEELNTIIDELEAKDAELLKKIDNDLELDGKNQELEDIEQHYPDISKFKTISDLREKRDELLAKVDKFHTDNPYEVTICDVEMEHGSLGEIENKLLSLAENILTINNAVKDNGDVVDSLKSDIEEIESSLSVTTMVELEMLKQRKEKIKELLQTEKEKENPYIEMIREQEEMLVGTDILYETLRAEESTLQHINYLIKLLTDPKSFIRKNIVDKYIPFVNKKILEYSEGVGLLHVSTINPDMTVDIDYMGKSVSFFSMSGGERLRLNISTYMAFRDLMRMLGQDCNIMLIDEFLDGTADASGMKAIFGMVEGFADDVFIISHRDEFKDQVDKTMKIVKSNGFSDIVIS